MFDWVGFRIGFAAVFQKLQMGAEELAFEGGFLAAELFEHAGVVGEVFIGVGAVDLGSKLPHAGDLGGGEVQGFHFEHPLTGLTPAGGDHFIDIDVFDRVAGVEGVAEGVDEFSEFLVIFLVEEEAFGEVLVAGLVGGEFAGVLGRFGLAVRGCGVRWIFWRWRGWLGFVLRWPWVLLIGGVARGWGNFLE